jgi:hypothetical protein
MVFKKKLFCRKYQEGRNLQVVVFLPRLKKKFLFGLLIVTPYYINGLGFAELSLYGSSLCLASTYKPKNNSEGCEHISCLN